MAKLPLGGDTTPPLSPL